MRKNTWPMEKKKNECIWYCVLLNIKSTTSIFFPLLFYIEDFFVSMDTISFNMTRWDKWHILNYFWVALNIWPEVNFIIVQIYLLQRFFYFWSNYSESTNTRPYYFKIVLCFVTLNFLPYTSFSLSNRWNNYHWPISKQCLWIYNRYL